MKSVSLSSRKHLAVTTRSGAFNGLARKIVLKQLSKLHSGYLRVVEPEGEMSFGQDKNSAAMGSTITIRDLSFYSDLAFGGSIGAGEA